MKVYYDHELSNAINALKNDNLLFFTSNFPKIEYWRLYNHYKDETAFLDIEATSLNGKITVVGIFDSYKTKTYVKGINLNEKDLIKEISKYKLVVTFNGFSFDHRLLSREFALKNIILIDLKPLLVKLGYKGGLKEIEKEFNIHRRPIINNISNGNALTLFKMYNASGDKYYLDLLIEYNEEDCANLKILMDKVYERLSNQIKSEQNNLFCKSNINN